MASHRGSCLCGEVAYEVDGPLEHAHHCHCTYCRKIHGTPCATGALAPGGAGCAASRASRATSPRPGSTAGSARAAGRALPGDPVGGIHVHPVRHARRRPGRSPRVPHVRRVEGAVVGDPRRAARVRRVPARHRCSARRGSPAARPARHAARQLPVRRGRVPDRRRADRGAQLPLRALPQGARRRARDEHARADRRAALHARRGRARGIQDPRGEVLHADVLPDLRLEGAAHRPATAASRSCRWARSTTIRGSGRSEHIWVGSKAPWHEIHDDLPRYDEGPPTRP